MTPTPLPPPPPKLLDRLRAAALAEAMPTAVADDFVARGRRYILFHGVRHPAELTATAVAAFCQFTGISRTFLYALMDGGRLRYIKLGKRRLIPRAELVRLLAGGLTGALAAGGAAVTAVAAAASAEPGPQAGDRGPPVET